MLIYKIYNDINDKVYIGRTKKSLAIRWGGHMKCLRRGDMRHIYCAMRKYGVENFHIEKICDCSSMEEMCELEAYYTKLYDSYNHGYNMTTAGEINPMDCQKSRYSHDQKMKTLKVRDKISKTMVKVREAQKNYITIHNDIKQKRIPKEQVAEFLSNGWKIGTLKNRRYMYNSELNIQKLIPEVLIDQYLREGWKFKKIMQYRNYKCLNTNKVIKSSKNTYKRKGGNVKYNTTDAFKAEQRDRLLKFYADNPNHLTKSKKPLCITNPETNESLYFDSCKEAAQALGLPEYCAKQGFFKKWADKNCISYKKSYLNGWKISFIIKDK